MHETRAGIQSVEVGFTLLDALSRAAGPLMLRDLAAAAGMSAAKAHRYLVSFQRLGLVVQDPRTTRYDLGPAALHLGLASLSSWHANASVAGCWTSVTQWRWRSRATVGRPSCSGRRLRV